MQDERVLLLDDARFDAHVATAYHPERPERLVAAREAVNAAVGGASGKTRVVDVAAREALDTELLRVHTPKFVETLEGLRGKRAFVDPDTFVAPGSVDAARLGAGGLVDLVDAMLAGGPTKGVALLRPPGHHATPSRSMGFCIVNSIAVAAAHARARGLSRVLVVDWDVHHGNGTQEAFYGDANVLYASLHQWPLYPGTGAADERGVGDGEGYTLNVPLTAHGGDALYRGAFDRILLPAFHDYRPELVLVSAGFDASTRDPLAQMDLSAAAFGWMASALREVAEAHAGGRMALVLEGGYDLVALHAGLSESVRGLLGHARETDVAGGSDVDNLDLARAAKAAGHVWRTIR